MAGDLLLVAGDAGAGGARGLVTTAGRSISAASIQVLRIRDGQIVLVRDFADPRILEEITRQ